MVDTTGITLLLGTFGILVLLRIPITFCLAFAALVTGMYLNIPLEAIVKTMADGVMNFSLLAIPFFIIMGEIMNEGGISEKIVALANLLVGRLPGGLALVNVLDSMFFGGISGSAVADVSSLGSIVIPMMKKQGYDPEFAVGLTVCSACQGIIIPPSHNMIIYAFAVGTASQLAGKASMPGTMRGSRSGESGICHHGDTETRRRHKTGNPFLCPGQAEKPDVRSVAEKRVVLAAPPTFEG